MKTTQVLVVDDHPLFRSGLILWLNLQPGLHCAGEADTIAAARQALASLQPDIILLDLRLPDGDGLDFAREIHSSHPEIRVIALSQNDEMVFAHRALEAGARGYVMKSEATEVLAQAIATVLGGEVFVSRPVGAALLHNLFPDPASAAPSLARLSDRELQVFQLIGSGLTTRLIAERLGISPKTVETYRENLKVKLGLADARSLTDAATSWVEKGDPALPSPTDPLEAPNRETRGRHRTPDS